MYVNNEVGTVQNMEKIYSTIKAKNKNCIFHTDCVQAFCKHSINSKNADIITMSGHKIQSAKGVGAMYIKKVVRVNNLHFGGGQEKGFRPGTENTYAIVAMGEACAIAIKNMEENYKKTTEKEILAVSFGTSYNDGREKTIGAIELELIKEYPDYEVCRAFTSQVIIDKLQKRDGTKINNVTEALEEAFLKGVKELIIQPTHLLNGNEYMDLAD